MPPSVIEAEGESVASLEERVSALEALLATETRVQAGIEIRLSGVQAEVQALHHTMRSFGITQDLHSERLVRMEKVLESATETLSTIVRLLTDGK